MKIKCRCLFCSIEFDGEAKEVKRGGAKYCSRKCSALAKKGITKVIPNCTCSVCDIQFYRAKSKQTSKLLFCSRKCKEYAQRADIGILVRKDTKEGTLPSDNSTYRAIAKRYFPERCVSCGYDKIPEILHVHHIDKNRSNRTKENLQFLCPTCHSEFHYLDKSGQWHNLRAVSLMGK